LLIAHVLFYPVEVLLRGVEVRVGYDRERVNQYLVHKLIVLSNRAFGVFGLYLPDK
jgi:hypothetical protein